MHSRLRTHAESIAFFGGGSREKAVSSLNSAHNSLSKCVNTVYSLFFGSIIFISVETMIGKTGLLDGIFIFSLKNYADYKTSP